MDWQKYELEQYQYFKDHYDADAIYMGGSNCYVPDILSKKYGRIEIKQPFAQCGQFSEANKNDTTYNMYIASKRREDATEQDATEWAYNFYKNKKTNYFLVNNTLYSLDKFFDFYVAFLEKRTNKKTVHDNYQNTLLIAFHQNGMQFIKTISGM